MQLLETMGELLRAGAVVMEGGCIRRSQTLIPDEAERRDVSGAMAGFYGSRVK
jgi:hypothetical protein